LAGVCTILATTFHVVAVPIEGATLIVAADGNVVATFEGVSPSTAYSNDLYLHSPGNEFGILFNNKTTPVGTTFDLGSFAAGTELIFRLHVNDTGHDFYTGPASRNPDGMAHARVDDARAGYEGSTYVEFEDLWGTPEGSSGFNDLFFSFSNTESSTGVPDGGAPLLLVGLALGALGMVRGKSR